MLRILQGIDTLHRHLDLLRQSPEAYCPEHCPHCNKSGLWLHGFYTRQSDREGIGSKNLNPIPIPRFFCPSCTRTCSRLPSCIPPRRWYLWKTQQTVLFLVLSGASYRKIAKLFLPSRRTISLWHQWLKDQLINHTFYLRSRFSDLGRFSSLTPFWFACFDLMSLADAMAWLDHDDVVVP